jgi:hypothetical protein
MLASDSESDFITTDSRQTEHLLRPVFMSCPTKIAKVITIALSSLLIALCTVSLSAIQNIIQTINDRMSQGLDIQLEILQTLLTVIRTIRKRTCFAPSLLPRATRLLSFEDLCPLGASAIPITQVPPQDVYYRADRERTYEQLPAPPQGVSLLFTYPRLVCSCPYMTLMFTAFRALTLITTPLLPPCSLNRSPNAPLSRLRSAVPVLSSYQSSSCSRRRPQSASRHSSNSL